MLFIILTKTFTNHNIRIPCSQCTFLYNILSSHGSHFTGRIPINVIATVPTSTTIITIYQWQRTVCVEGYWIEKSIFLLNADHTPNEKHSTVSSEMCLWWSHQMIKLYRLLNLCLMNLGWVLLFFTKLVQNSPTFPLCRVHSKMKPLQFRLSKVAPDRVKLHKETNPFVQPNFVEIRTKWLNIKSYYILNVGTYAVCKSKYLVKLRVKIKQCK